MQMASFGLAIVASAWIVALLVSSLGLPASQARLVGSLVLPLGIVTRALGGVLVGRMGVRALLTGSFVMNAAACVALGLESSAGRLADWTGSFRPSFLALGGFSLVACAATLLLNRDEPAPTL
jgi:nitrate/nitrite transporter NarK